MEIDFIERVKFITKNDDNLVEITFKYSKKVIVPAYSFGLMISEIQNELIRRGVIQNWGEPNSKFDVVKKVADGVQTAFGTHSAYYDERGTRLIEANFISEVVRALNDALRGLDFQEKIQ